MIEKNFGTNKILYTVIEKPAGNIEVHVFTANLAVREVIKNHCAHPKYFLQNEKKYANSDTAAKIWLARIISEYRKYFLDGKVQFVLRAFNN